MLLSQKNKDITLLIAYRLSLLFFIILLSISIYFFIDTGILNVHKFSILFGAISLYYFVSGLWNLSTTSYILLIVSTIIFILLPLAFQGVLISPLESVIQNALLLNTGIMFILFIYAKEEINVNVS